MNIKALILNSGRGSRMGDITKTHPKCMTVLSDGKTIIQRQLEMLEKCGIKDAVITTGYYDGVLTGYCDSLGLDMNIEYVKNPLYESTNYIYSVYLAKEKTKDCDIILMHGDLVFEESVLRDIVSFPGSCMKVSSTQPVPEKDFKAVVKNGCVSKVGVEFFEDVVEAQALYRLTERAWKIWTDRIAMYCEKGDRLCYAEKALNAVSLITGVYPLDVKDRLCAEIDTPEDLEKINMKIQRKK